MISNICSAWMSACGGKADVEGYCEERPLMPKADGRSYTARDAAKPRRTAKRYARLSFMLTAVTSLTVVASAPD
jgi:hypothetical protein